MSPRLRVVAIVQARMGSSRLPGKVLLPLAGEPVLTHVVNRVRASDAVDEVTIATTTSGRDDAIAALASGLGTRLYRGSEPDVLSRYRGAAADADADVVVRVTADCPLIDPDVLHEMVHRFRDLRQREDAPVDVLTNARVRRFPRGLDTEIFTRRALEAADAEGTAPHHREHVTPFLYEHPDRFRIVDHLTDADFSHYRLTLDTQDDYVLLTRLFQSCGSGSQSGPRLRTVLDLLTANPAWSSIDAQVRQKTLNGA